MRLILLVLQLKKTDQGNLSSQKIIIEGLGKLDIFAKALRDHGCTIIVLLRKTKSF